MKQSEFDPHVRLRAMGIMFVVVALIAVVQLTPFAPFPHRIDSFVDGLASGMGLMSALGWIILRRGGANKDSSPQT